MQASLHFENSPLFFPNLETTMGDKCGFKMTRKVSSLMYSSCNCLLVKSRILKNLAFFQICRNVSRSTSYYVIMRKHTNEQASDLFTDWTKKRISGITLMIRDVSLVLAWNSSADCNGVWYTNDGQDLLYFSSFWHWHGALCITCVLRWTTRVVCSLRDQNCQIWTLVRWEKRH